MGYVILFIVSFIVGTYIGKKYWRNNNENNSD